MKVDSNALLLDRRGAAMVFGIFFAVFLLACVFKLYGVAEVLLYRQHQQDAADASAFAAAVVNARGMNLIALINMTMAAVLAVLVGLRLAQTLCIIGIALCAVLAYPTMGNSMSYVPTLAKASYKIENKMIKKVKKVMPKVLSALHMAGKAVSVVVPLGSNARVLEVAKTQHGQRVGLALPSRLTLPVEDGQFIDLCRHAGALAAEIAMFPLSPVIRGRVKDGIASASGAIAAAAPDWFCGEQAKGQKPDMDPGGELDPISLPVMPRQQECDEITKKVQAMEEASDADLAELEQVCSGAAVEFLASSPGQDGLAREGEPLCPTDCLTNPRSSCPPAGTELCDPAQAAEIDGYAVVTGQSTIVAGGEGSPYGVRLQLAHEQCDPRAPHNYPLGGFSWVQQTITYRYDWNAKTKKHEHNERFDLPHATTLVRNKDEDRSIPCGDGGVVGAGYGADPSKVCESVGFCSNEDASAIGSGPCIPLNTDSYFQTHMVVVGILRCAELRPHEKVETPDIDMEKELNQSKKKSQNTSPFQLEKDVWLGGSDFQLRAVVIGQAPNITGGEGVKLATWGKEEERLDQALTEVPQGIGCFALSQAEYYFDLAAFPKFSDQQKQEDRVEWLWNQGWVSRLRPFRLSYKKTDAPRSKKLGYDSEQSQFADPSKPAEPSLDLSSVAGEKGASDLGAMLQ